MLPPAPVERYVYREVINNEQSKQRRRIYNGTQRGRDTTLNRAIPTL